MGSAFQKLAYFCYFPLILFRRAMFATRVNASVSMLSQSLSHRLFSSSLRSRSFASLLEFTTIHPSRGRLVPADFQSKAALVVNTASKCSHASQLKQLQELHERYYDRGLVVLAVPSNDFAGQEPGSATDMLKRYAAFGVTFFVTEKTPVKGEHAHPFFKQIAEKYSTSVAPTWNFDKFLVDHGGKLRAVFPNDTEPLMEEVVQEIDEVLEDLSTALDSGQQQAEEYDFEEAELNEDSDDEDQVDDDISTKSR
ncbi:hypothetical protein PsorP6_010452 [Peronosclerospora sorghi]|uniref:Uncharacterized protein n=1 Tax=Peronosclerospora sorghi TaxID=230839 RepID=A0ACC0VU96_9STRA|nr:hypothetical protein PsorP6_010452 [Peronosclerospora sorghi]